MEKVDNMQILFLTLMKIYSPDDEGIYMDLMKCFADNGHKLYIVTPLEKKDEADEEVIEAGNLKIIRFNKFKLISKCIF